MRTIGSLLVAAAAVVPTLALAQVRELELTCIYEAADRADVLAVIEAEPDPDPDAQTVAQSQAMDRFADNAVACASRYGWSDPRIHAAITYTLGRVGYEAAVQALAVRGLEPQFLEQVASDLGEEGLANMESADDRPENLEFVGEVVARRLAAAGHHIAPGSDEWSEIGSEVGRGLGAKRVQERAARDFGRQ